MQATDCTIIKAFPAEERVYMQTFGTVICAIITLSVDLLKC